MSTMNESRRSVGLLRTGRRTTGPAARRWTACLATVLATGLVALPLHASRRALDPSLDPAAAPRLTASILALDFDPREGSTVVGISSSAPLGNHTVYESDATTVVVELPDVDVSRLEPIATIGTPQVERVKVEMVERGATKIARFEIRKAAGARRTVAVDPKNPNRLEIVLTSSDALASTGGNSPVPQPVATQPAAPPRILAALPEASAPGHAVPQPRPLTSPSSPSIAPEARPLMPPASAGARSVSTAMAAFAPAFEPAPAHRGPARLMNLSVEASGDGRTLIRLLSDRPLEAESMVLQNAPRLVIDLKDTINALPFANLPVRDSAVLKVRVSQFEPIPAPVTRVVIDWRSEEPYRIQRGPDSLLIIVGAGDPSVPAMALNDFSPAPLSGRASAAQQGLGGPDADSEGASLISGPSGLANLGRPTTLSGAALAPLPAGAQSGYTADAASHERAAPGRLRETANTGGIQVVDPHSHDKSVRFAEVKVTGNATVYTGDPISISVKDADLQDLFRLFHEVSGLNIVVDPAVKGRSITLELVDVPWDQAMDIVLRVQALGQSLEGNVLRIAPVTKLAQEEQQQKQLKEARELAQDVYQVAFPLSYAAGPAAEAIIRKSLSQRGEVALDRRTNTLIIKDLPERLENVKALLALLDQPTKQVMIESRIVETTLDFSKAVGIQWGFAYIADRAFGNSTGFSFPRSVAADYAVNLPVQAAASTLGLSFRNILNTFALDIQIAALEDRGKARIISRPMVMVQNNEQAQIESGVQIPISSTTATEIEITYVSASLKLTVQPQITADDNVVMDLKVENNAPVFIQTAGDNASISTRQAETVVAVPNGGTTIIGGIYQVNEGAASTRVPFMSRIPLLGWLFRNKTINRTNDELLIFITPRIQKA